MDKRTQVMIIGGALGGVIGVLAAHMYLRSLERGGEESELEMPAVEPGDLIKLTLSILGVLKLVDRLGKPGAKKKKM